MEGYEIEALRGAKRALAAGRIRALYVEVGGPAGEPALTLLREQGYRVHNIEPTGQLTGWKPGHAYDCALCLAPETKA